MKTKRTKQSAAKATPAKATPANPTKQSATLESEDKAVAKEGPRAQAKWRIAALNEYFERTIPSLNGLAVKLQLALDTAKGEIHSMQATLKAQNHDIWEERSDLQQAMWRYKESSDKATKEVAELRKRVSILEAERFVLLRTIEEHKENLKRNPPPNPEIEAKAEGERVAQAMLDNQRLRGKVEAMTQEIGRLNEAAFSLRDENQAVRKAGLQACTQAESAIADAKRYFERARSLEEQLTEARQETARLQGECNKRDAEILQAVDARIEAERNAEALKAQETSLLERLKTHQ